MIATTDISKRIQEGLDIRRMTQQDLSDRTGIPKSSISQYISGHTKPRNDRIYLIAKALQVPEPWLLGYEIELNQNNNSGTISNNINSNNDNSTNDSSSTITNNYYSAPCERHIVSHEVEATINSKEYFYQILMNIKDMTDEQLQDVIKYTEFVLNK